MTKRLMGLARWMMGATCACGLSLTLSAACGSGDAARKDMKEREAAAGAGGQDVESLGGQGTTSGGASESGGGAGNPGESPGGVAAGGEPSIGTAGGGAGAGAGAGAEGGAGGAPGESCESLAPSALQGVWQTSCNGYSCAMSITASGEVGNGCSNGQYETGTLVDGQLDTLGEGGPYQPYSAKGTLVRTACDSVTRDYIAQIPPNTGPEQAYSCVMTRSPSCGPSLLQALSGAWNGACGSSTCVTTITAAGEMSSTCSNGQHSVGSVKETGYFTDEGSGGNFPAYSTSGVVSLTDCDSFLMAYTWQSPPNTGKKTSSKCTYTRQPPP